LTGAPLFPIGGRRTEEPGETCSSSSHPSSPNLLAPFNSTAIEARRRRAEQRHIAGHLDRHYVQDRDTAREAAVHGGAAGAHMHARAGGGRYADLLISTTSELDHARLDRGAGPPWHRGSRVHRDHHHPRQAPHQRSRAAAATDGTAATRPPEGHGAATNDGADMRGCLRATGTPTTTTLLRSCRRITEAPTTTALLQAAGRQRRHERRRRGEAAGGSQRRQRQRHCCKLPGDMELPHAVSMPCHRATWTPAAGGARQCHRQHASTRSWLVLRSDDSR
jgi:hypothetical protein